MSIEELWNATDRYYRCYLRCTNDDARWQFFWLWMYWSHAWLSHFHATTKLLTDGDK